MDFKDNILLGAIFVMLVVTSIWLQFGLLVEPDGEPGEAGKNDPDYYAEKFVLSGVDKSGKKYQVIAERMVHYPDGDRALLDNPHIIQYDLNNVPRHIYADSGWLYDNQSTVLLTGNVKVIQTQTDASGGAVSSQRMVIHLRDKDSS